MQGPRHRYGDYEGPTAKVSGLYGDGYDYRIKDELLRTPGICQDSLGRCPKVGLHRVGPRIWGWFGVYLDGIAMI